MCFSTLAGQTEGLMKNQQVGKRGMGGAELLFSQEDKKAVTEEDTHMPS